MPPSIDKEKDGLYNARRDNITRWWLTEAQVAALERRRDEQMECGEIDTAHPGYLGSQDTFYVGTMKGVGRIYQQTFVDTYAKVAVAKLYTTKTPIAAADVLNDECCRSIRSTRCRCCEC